VASSISFAFKCSYLNSVYFTVADHTGTYEIQFRTRTSAYEQSIYNGTADDYANNCASIVGWLSHHKPIPSETVKAYNEWRLAENARWLSLIEKFPERYGDATLEDRQPTLLAKGAVHWCDGWQFEPIEKMEHA